MARATNEVIRAEVAGLRDTVVQRFDDVQRQLDEDETVPTKLARLETRVESLERRREWARGPAMLGLVGLVAAIVGHFI